MKKNSSMQATGCCPKFNPELWQEREIVWHDKPFLKDRVFSVFHIPLNFGKVMTRNMEKIKSAQALLPDTLVLSDENSLFGADIYIAVNKDVPNAEMVRFSGTFFTKVFEGEYKDMGKWIKAMREYVSLKQKEIKKMYFFYTTCPKCAKHYGENYTVILAEV